MRLLLIVIVSSNALCAQASEQLFIELSQSNLKFLHSEIDSSDSKSIYNKELKLIRRYIENSLNMELVNKGKYRSLFDSIISHTPNPLNIECIFEFTNIESYVSIIYSMDTLYIQRTYELGNQINNKPELVSISKVDIEDIDSYFLNRELIDSSCIGFKAVWLSFYLITKIENLQNWNSLVLPTRCTNDELKNYYRLNFLEP